MPRDLIRRRYARVTLINPSFHFLPPCARRSFRPTAWQERHVTAHSHHSCNSLQNLMLRKRRGNEFPNQCQKESGIMPKKVRKTMKSVGALGHSAKSTRQGKSAEIR